MIDAKEALRILAETRTDEIVVTTMSAAREWPLQSRRPDLDVAVIGAMGKASSLALGLALARPERRVLVLDGDGSLLTNLGSLVTVAAMAPTNFVHFVIEGGTYDTTGGQPIPGAGIVDFPGLALEAGYHGAYEFDDLDEFESALTTILNEDGPILVNLKVHPRWSTHPFPKRGMAEMLADLARAL